MNQFPPGHLVPIKIVSKFSKIRGDIREGMFVSGVNDTGDKFSSKIEKTKFRRETE
jgi:hypothetical protein